MMKDKLKSLRKSRGLTQEQLAEALHLSQSTITSWENGKRRPDISLLPSIAEFYGVSINDIYGEEQSTEVEIESDADRLRERMRRDPSFRLLFNAAEKVKTEHIELAAAMLKALGNNDDD